MKRASVIFILFCCIACEKIVPGLPDDADVLDGTVEGLSHAQLRQHLAGDEAFNDEVFTEATGLGPLFVATSCVSCHAGDGKGHPFTTLTRFGQTDTTGNHYLHQGGPQLQNRALPGYEPEQIPVGAPAARFTPPAVTGLGFFEFVTDADIIAMADPADADGDGISGVPNWIDLPHYALPAQDAVVQNGKYIGRFGKKASVYNLLQQTSNAYNQDMGITSIYEPADVYTHAEIDPEVTTATVLNVVFYLQTLKAPLRRNAEDAQIQSGEHIFTQIGCENCHKQTVKTGASPIEALSHKEFHPYTDLLLHDMGSDLDDGYTEGSAKTSEWRTAPLWGLGLSPDAQGGNYFLLHDGRARSIGQAIEMHGGEAETAKNNFMRLSESDKQALLTFLQSL